MKNGTSLVVSLEPNGNRPADTSAEQLTEQNVETVTGNRSAPKLQEVEVTH